MFWPLGRKLSVTNVAVRMDIAKQQWQLYARSYRSSVWVGWETCAKAVQRAIQPAFGSYTR
jgi:hypothetical protein